MESWTRRRLQIDQSFELGMHLRRRPSPDAQGTLFYIHGLGESGLCFESLMSDPRLAGWSQVAPDLPGYGKSFWCPEALGLEEMSQRLMELLDSLGEGPVVLAGHSMGGVLATLMLETIASRVGKAELASQVRGLINIEGNIASGDCGFSARATSFSLDDWLDHGASQILQEIYEQPEIPRVRQGYGASYVMADPRAFHRNSRDLVGMSAAEDLAGRMAALGVPQLFLHGVPRGLCSRSVELLDQAEVPRMGIDDTGHWFYLERQDATVDALVTFLESLPGSDLRRDEL